MPYSEQFLREGTKRKMYSRGSEFRQLPWSPPYTKENKQTAMT